MTITAIRTTATLTAPEPLQSTGVLIAVIALIVVVVVVVAAVAAALGGSLSGLFHTTATKV